MKRLCGLIPLFLGLASCGENPTENTTLYLDVRGQNVPQSYPRLPIFSVVAWSSAGSAPIESFRLIAQVHHDGQPPTDIVVTTSVNGSAARVDQDSVVVHEPSQEHYHFYTITPSPSVTPSDGVVVSFTITEDGEGQIIYWLQDFRCGAALCDVEMTDGSQNVAWLVPAHH